MKRILPWWAKIVIKILLSRIPVNYRIWSFFGIFKHGRMADAFHALKIFRYHFDRVNLPASQGELSMLELGVGDSVASALIAHTFGATRSAMIDVGSFATRDVGNYMQVVDALKSEGLEPLPIEHGVTFAGMLEQYGAQYLTEGLSSLKGLPDNSVHFAWSEAVLEHVRLAEFDEILSELYRISTPNSIHSHRIDLRDHLDYSLNNLRFSRAVWESNFMAISGFYTNRIRYSDMAARFKRAGFRVEIVIVDRWSELPIAKKLLSDEFSSLSDEELLVSCFDVILRPNPSYSS